MNKGLSWKEFCYLNEERIIVGDSYMALKRLCKKAGCNRLATPPHRYCEQHLYLEREEEEKRKAFLGGKVFASQWSELYTSTRWKEMSKNQLKKEPLCAVCGNKATEVHHRIAHRGNLDLFYNEDNLVSLCHDCHSRETMKEIRERRKKDQHDYQMRTRHHLLGDNYEGV